MVQIEYVELRENINLVAFGERVLTLQLRKKDTPRSGGVMDDMRWDAGQRMLYAYPTKETTKPHWIPESNIKRMTPAEPMSVEVTNALRPEPQPDTSTPPADVVETPKKGRARKP
jgi:hypothetical protein